METDLSDIIYKNRLSRTRRTNYESWKIKAMIEMAEGMKELHDLGMIHRDIKPDNIMIGYNNTHKKAQIKLVDFGLSTQVDEDEEVNDVVGTPYFMAPEIDGKTFYGKPVDIYALGIVFYIFLRNEDVRLVYSNQNRRISLFIFDHIQKYKGLIQAMVSTNPSSRPTIDDVLTALYNIQSKQSSGFKAKKIQNPMSDLERCFLTNQLNQEYKLKNRRFMMYSPKTFSGANCMYVLQIASRNGSLNRFMMMLRAQQQPRPKAMSYYKKRQGRQRGGSPKWAFAQTHRILI
jgi:serine/threonine protein kinase